MSRLSRRNREPVQDPSREQYGPVDGVVQAWNHKEGWGVLVPDGTSLEVWALWAMIAAKGYWEPRPGQRVRFGYEIPGQDGYPARALVGIKALD